MKPIIWATVASIAALVLIASWYWITPHSTSSSLSNTPSPSTITHQETALPSSNQPSTPTAATRTVNLGTVENIHPAFAATIIIPSHWQIEVIPTIEAVNLYDPTATGSTAREQSQIFLRHFSANDFLTLSTVTIFSRTPTTINDRPAVQYDIAKKSGIADFPQQPSWRNQRHHVTDIRLTASNPSEFLVIGQNPALPDNTFQQILQSITTDSTTSQTVVPPAANFLSTITKKPFGISIAPDNSPIQPERFAGYHTAVDAELPADTPIVAIASGTVLQSGHVNGYGGLIAIEHMINSQRLVGIYGHLDPASLISNNQTVVASQRIGVLGQGFTTETAGERPHLHFGLYRGPGVDIRGYVPTTSELSQWLDPTTLF